MALRVKLRIDFAVTSEKRQELKIAPTMETDSDHEKKPSNLKL